MAVVVLPTPPFWLTMARTVALVVDNILGLARTADPTSGVMRGIVSFPSPADQPPCQEAERVDRGRIVAAVERPARPFGALPVPVRPLPRLAPYRPREKFDLDPATQPVKKRPSGIGHRRRTAAVGPERERSQGGERYLQGNGEAK